LAIRRRLAAIALVALLAAMTARADETTHLSDESGALQVDLPGTWRTLDGKFAFAASGFVGGVKRTEVYAVVYADLKDADAAAKRWRDARTAEVRGVEFTNPGGDASRWIVIEPGKKTVDYGRALAGADVAAVVWARITGEPGAMDTEVFALLDRAKLEKAVATGADGKSGATDTHVVKDREFALELTLNKALAERKDVDPPEERLVLALKGAVGADKEAFLGVYAFPDFDRADAATWWWIEQERRGWQKSGLRVEGGPPAFKVLVNGETWTRHVRVLPTKAGVYALKLDVESACDQAGAALLDDLVETRSLVVTRPRPDAPVPPPGSAKTETAAHFVLSEAAAEEADAIAKDALWADETVGKVLGLDALDGRKGVLRVMKDQAAMDAALRPLGGPAARAAWWSVRTREVFCRAGVLAADKTLAEFLFETSRESVRRRFGFRPPFWVEYGVGHLLESGAYNRNRIDQTLPTLNESARDSVGVNIEFESVRWWSESDSATNPERNAIAWVLWLMLTEEGAVAQKWAEPLKAYLVSLRQTGNPGEATKVFPYDRDADLVEEYKRRVKKIER
jgi:hypothetical protein